MAFREYFDSVLMLTWSDWKTEPRANRYHYASRFARHVPVFFVQADLKTRATDMRIEEEKTELPNVTIWHVSMAIVTKNQREQKALFEAALLRAGARRPLMWIYNTNFSGLIAGMHGSLRVYHATEDYFSHDLFPYPEAWRVGHAKALKNIDLLVSVSEGVGQSYRERGGYRGPAMVLPNGCDYAFYAAGAATPPARAPRKVALFQGAINDRLDFDLLNSLADELADWDLRFCGKLTPGLAGWERLTAKPNVRYLGFLAPEQIRDECYAADVGIIPYAQQPSIVERSLPIKAFEYVAAGLPVVSVPIRALERFPVFEFAAEAGEFALKCRSAAETRLDPEALGRRAALAKTVDYDVNFNKLLESIEAFVEPRAQARKNILVLYDEGSTHVSTIVEHLESFSNYSRHRVLFAPATGRIPCAFDPDLFDAIIIHYSVRLSLEDHLSFAIAERLAMSTRQKVLFIQDEYDTPEVARRWIERLGIHTVFTCVPQASLNDVYPASRFPGVRFVTTLTGYVPERYSKLGAVKRLEDRPNLIGYRGRELPFWYGELGREKLEIGIRMREICESRGLPVDIEWTSEKRIYGPGWYEFVQNNRTMLGTESGSNVFDDTGEIKRKIEEALRVNPALTYAEARERFLQEVEGRVVQNQVSPKIFEAIAFRTGLVLFEGRYSDVVRPWEHFIPLKKDYSNVDEVLAAVHDVEKVRAMTERAYRDVIESGKYSYGQFVAEFDAVIDAWRETGVPQTLVLGATALIEPDRYISFAQRYGPARYAPSDRVFSGRRPDEVIEVATPASTSPDAMPTVLIAQLATASLLKRLPIKTLLRYAVRNAFVGLPPWLRGPLEKPVKMLLAWRRAANKRPARSQSRQTVK